MIEVRQPNSDDRAAIKNLGTFFRYDLLPFITDGAGSRLNQFGTFGDDGVTTHEQSIAEQDIWWTKTGVLLPMLIRVDDQPAGFALVARPPHAHRSVDYRMEDFFIVNRFRRGSVGTAAAREIFTRHPGRWEVGWVPKNKPAELFWRSVAHPWQPKDWVVPQAPGTPGLPGLWLTVERA